MSGLAGLKCIAKWPAHRRYSINLSSSFLVSVYFSPAIFIQFLFLSLVSPLFSPVPAFGTHILGTPDSSYSLERTLLPPLLKLAAALPSPALKSSVGFTLQ